MKVKGYVGCAAAVVLASAVEGLNVPSGFAVLSLSTALATAEEDVVVEADDEGQETPPSEEDMPQPDPQEVERLQKLFAGVSESCRMEVQTAYAEGKDVSQECKDEIQQVMAQATANGEQPKQPKEDRPDPRMTILGFVFLLLAAMVGWGVYAQQNLVSTVPEAPKKKLSKKKLLKEKIKAQKENQGIN